MDKVYIGGKAQYGSSAPPITLDFMIDCTTETQAQGTATTVTIPKGAVVYGFRAVVTQAFTSGGSGTVQLGFTGVTMLSAATGVATLVEGYVLGPDQTGVGVYTLATSDTFDCIVGTADLLTGKLDVTIFYHPPRGEAFKNTEYKEFQTE